jgi:hypothetical protein
MANLTITTQGSVFLVNFGVYGPAPTIVSKKRTFQKAGVGFSLYHDDSHVVVDINGFPSWRVIKEPNPDWPDALVIDSVNGVAPDDNEHLFDLLVTALTS